jgi:hypothetical protein
MKKPDLINILSNPFFLAALFVLPGIIYNEATVQKFVSETIHKSTVSEGQVYRYDDLNGDGKADLVRTKINNHGNAALVIEINDTILGQVNLKGEFPILCNNTFTGDYNSDRKMEIFAVTHSDANIWLSQVGFSDTSTFKIKEIFIDSLWWKDGEDKFTVDLFGMYDMNGDGTKELLFKTSAGFSIYPRRVYCYDIKNDTLIKSIAFGTSVNIAQIADIDGDSYPEIMLASAAPDNMMGKYALPCPDNASWIVVLDHKLNLKFEPVKAGGTYSNTKVYYTKLQGREYLVAQTKSMGNRKSFTPKTIALRMLDSYGNIVKTNNIGVVDKYPDSEIDHNGVMIILEQGQLWQIDTLLRKKKYKKNGQLSRLDIHFSNNYKTGDYYLFSSYETGGIVFGDAAFNQFIPIDVVFKRDRILQVCKLEPFDGNPQFAIQSGEELTHFIIKINPHYIYRFGYYTGGYLILFTFILLIQWLQSRQMNKRFETERTISRLRLRAIKNEISPHFTLNVLNSIVALAYKGEPDKVYKKTMQFSKLIQASLLDSEKMTRTLEEELDFVKNYLDLQKLRFGDKIKYLISVGENVDYTTLLPKMVVQTYAENAYKHGLAMLENGGVLKINITQTDKYMIIEIDDNGAGRELTRKNKSGSTGKGQKIMQEYYRIINAMNKQKISCEIIDKKNEEEKPAGTKVIIKIPSGCKYEI